MKLLQAGIDSFKSLKNVIIPLDGLVIFFGKNGAGVQALEAVAKLAMAVPLTLRRPG